MLTRLALLACALYVMQPAFAQEPVPTTNLCRQTMPAVRELWQHDLYGAPPAVAAVMLDAIDGKLPQVRQGLAALPPHEQAHWRQVAMITAANTFRPAVVDSLLADGADADAPVRLPPFKSGFYQQTVSDMAHDPRFGPKAVAAFQSAGLMGNSGNLVGPALPLAALCDDVATLDVLLRHHANTMAREAPGVGDALTTAVIGGHAEIVQHLLDHGADACADDRLIRKPGATLASIGRRRHLPDALLQRLACPAYDSH